MQQREEGSFRDPSGFLYWEQGKLIRQVNICYKEHYDWLIESGLYKKLIDEKLLISHQELSSDTKEADTYKLISPEVVHFISYPYEWCFSQLKDAALTTLRIQKIAMKYGVTLKDASAYNIQFHNGKPILIDTLSFEKYQEGMPWVAYRQFCQHFLAPLVLMAYTDIRLSQLLRVYIDGIPLDLASKLLPRKTKFKFSVLMNIHLHAKSQKQHEDKPKSIKNYEMSRRNLMALIDSLESAVQGLKWKAAGTEWGDYYSITNYTEDAFDKKKTLVNSFLEKAASNYVWDLGANTGVFSRIASNKDIKTVAFDIDPVAVEKNYLYSKKYSEANILPLLLDLTNPSSGIGWSNTERKSILQRMLPDTVMALALIHHLAISNNVPLVKIAQFFSNIGSNLIIEFVPKSDSQVQKLLSSREDIFNCYDEENFEKDFSRYFTIIDKQLIEGTQRTLYLMVKNTIV